MSGPARRLLAAAALLAAVAGAAALAVRVRLAPARLPPGTAPFYRTAAGEPLFYTPDAFYHLRLARELAENGRRGEPREDGRRWDGKSFAPEGRPVRASLLQDLEAWVWRLWPGEASLAAVAFYLPAALSALLVALAFWIGRRLAGAAGGLAAALLTALHPELVSHTHAGMADTAALVLVGLTLAAGVGLGLAHALWRRGGTPRRRAWLVAAALALAAALAALALASPAGRRLADYLGRESPGPFPSGVREVQELGALAPAEAIDRLGGWPAVVLAAGGVLWLAVRAPRPGGPLGALLLAAWALPAIAAGTRAMRFLVYAAPAVALAAGCALAAIAGGLARSRSTAAPTAGDPSDGYAAGGSPARSFATSNRGGDRHRRPLLTAALAIAAVLLLAWPWRARLEGFAARRPAADLALAEAAAAIAAQSPADALVYAWWDHGHALAALADRGVVLDGASFQTPRLYWLAAALTAQDETLGANVLRLIGCGGEDDLYAVLVRDGSSRARSVTLMRRALRQPDLAGAARALRQAGVGGEAVAEAGRLLACRPPPSWLVVTSDLTAKSSSWAWFGVWRFDGPNRPPGPRMTAPVRCTLSPDGRLECADSTTADLARDGFEDRSTPGHFAAAGPPWPDGLAPVLHQHGSELLLTWVRPWLVESLFARLYLFEGRGLERFRLEGVFHHPPHTQRVLVYRIVWDAAEEATSPGADARSARRIVPTGSGPEPARPALPGPEPEAPTR